MISAVQKCTQVLSQHSYTAAYIHASKHSASQTHYYRPLYLFCSISYGVGSYATPPLGSHWRLKNQVKHSLRCCSIFIGRTQSVNTTERTEHFSRTGNFNINALQYITGNSFKIILYHNYFL